MADEVRRSHPTVTDAAGAPLDAACDVDRARALWRRDLPPAAGPVEAVAFGRGDLGAVRRLVRQRATPALGPARAADLTLAVNELTANSLDHGGGRGVLRTWSEPGALLFEVADSGRLDDVLVGRTPPVPGQPRGRGVWMVNQLCDLVQIRSTAAGTVVRVHSWV
ncbi:ATP-binding protein [Cellulomonas sp. ATA003]|uniref:ATP-binding protein n=1 Tax=Cellulomonas sp. ATA003 TaxID=3073064 RepID=UPI0028737E74|nr:ATP-binding protein [Cellulomonas sp. ATA003]WNB85379.1 ATP-binding protein [Cellulomonas sp. ATA003]